jgi:hypothetical protein
LIITDIDNFIVDRLEKIKFNQEPITVYSYKPSRDKGQLEFPSLSVLRLEHNVSVQNRRFGIDDFTPSVEKKVVQNPGGGFAIVPDHFIRRPFPTPIDIKYAIDTFSTDKEQSDWLLYMMLQAFPPGYQPKISNQYPSFVMGKPVNRDELAIPLFRTTYVIGVLCVWVERIEHYNDAPLSDMDIDFHFENTDIL